MKRNIAFIYCFASMLCWSVSPVLVRYIKDYFSVSFQNFFRFAVAIVIMWSFTLLTIGGRTAWNSLKSISYSLPKLFLVAVCNFCHQIFLIKGVYLLMPGLVTIVEESTIIFSTTLAYIFIPAERSLIRKPAFMAGLLMAVAGVVITSLPELSGVKDFAGDSPVMGLLFVFISSLAWAGFSLMIKLWFTDVPSAVTSSIVFTLVIPIFLISILFDKGPALLQACIPVKIWLLTIVSGIIGIGLGYSFYYQSIKGLGIALNSSLGLLIPVITAVISFLFLGERLLPVQIAGAIVLLSGSLIVVRAEGQT
ncbi:MAG: DMT family transporter [Spirochaetales bacterium]|nr:DMT family transporter [Spirochaetales bacterium]